MGISQGNGPAPGAFNGVPMPKLMAGKMRIPLHMRVDGGTLALTAATYYVAPFWFDGGETFAGVAFRQSGSETGKNVKIAFYGQALSGGPGTLAKSFGAIALPGAAANNQMASAWTPARGWYFGELVSDSTPTLCTMCTLIAYSTVGQSHSIPHVTGLGSFISGYLNAAATGTILGDTIAGTYANFPEATSLAPTATLNGSTSNFPAFGPYA